tara:strand:+ start:45 stop:776 length:732 start_codon:yes stop_codon:yes gene_type:complete
MYKNITELKNKHLGKDIWIVLAGSSMNYVSNSFFENKIVLGTNQVYKHFPCTYIVMKDCMERPRYTRSIQELKEKSIPLIFSEYYKGSSSKEKNTPDYENSYVFSHNTRTTSIEKEIEDLSDDNIVVSKSTVTSLIHIAAYMGAKNIILCGHDCGTLDGDLYYEGYMEDDWISSANWSGISTWMSTIERESQSVRKYLMKKYNCNIHSLNPFLNLGLENHDFVKTEPRIAYTVRPSRSDDEIL